MVLVLSGCAFLPAADCSDVGAISGVVFRYDDVLATHPGEDLLVEACVASTCDTVQVDPSTGQQELATGRDLVTSDRPVPVSLTVSDLRGGTVFETGDGDLRQTDPRAP